jgi:hypothetical protein
MIDWINAEPPPNSLNNVGLEFIANVNLATGEQYDEWEKAIYWPFVIYRHSSSGRTIIQGSLHKYWSGSHNGGAFPQWAVAQAVQRLATALGLDPAQVDIHGLEWGANVPMLTQARNLLLRAVLHGTKPMDRREWNGKGCMRKAVHEDFAFKVYDKEAQLIELIGNTLRVECKAYRMKFVKTAGIKTLADLANPAALEVLGELLLTQLKKVLFAPPGPLPQTLTPAARELLREGSSNAFWKRDGPKLQPRMRAQLKRYRKLMAQHIADPELEAATQGLRSVWQQLLTQPAPVVLATGSEPPVTQIPHLCSVGKEYHPQDRVAAAPPLVKDVRAGGLPASSPCLPADDDAPTATRWPDLTNRNSSPGPHDDDDSQHDHDDDHDHDETGARRWPHLPNRYASSSPHGNEATPVAALVDGVADDDDEREPLPPAARRCQTCGRVLTSSSSRAKFCSERELGAAAKKCRNDDSNPRNNAAATRRKTKSRGPQLFDDSPFVRVPEHYRAFVLAAA